VADGTHQRDTKLLQFGKDRIGIIDVKGDAVDPRMVRFGIRLTVSRLRQPFHQIETGCGGIVSEPEKRGAAAVGRGAERRTGGARRFLVKFETNQRFESQLFIKADRPIEIGDVDVHVIDAVQVHAGKCRRLRSSPVAAATLANCSVAKFCERR